MNNRPAASTGVSPFFLSHGYDMEMVQLSSSVTPRRTNSPVAAGERIAKKFADAHAWAQAALAAAKDEQEKQANRHRDAAPAYKPGDKCGSTYGTGKPIDRQKNSTLARVSTQSNRLSGHTHTSSTHHPAFTQSSTLGCSSPPQGTLSPVNESNITNRLLYWFPMRTVSFNKNEMWRRYLMSAR